MTWAFLLNIIYRASHFSVPTLVTIVSSKDTLACDATGVKAATDSDSDEEDSEAQTTSYRGTSCAHS